MFISGVPAECTRHDFEHRRTQAWVGWRQPLICFFRGGGGEARAQKDGQQVLRAASKRFLTEDEARDEQWKTIQAVHPRSTWASQDEQRSTEFLVDDYSPLVQPMIHAVVEGQLEPGRLQEGIDLLQQT